MNVHYSSIDLRKKYFFYNYEITGGLGGFWLDFPVLGEVLSAGETNFQPIYILSRLSALEFHISMQFYCYMMRSNIM
jgi:hypothetical protein